MKNGKILSYLAGHPNPVPGSSSKKCEWLFTEEMLERALLAKLFASGPHDLLPNKLCFYCMVCKKNNKIASGWIYGLKRQFQLEHLLLLDQLYRSSNKYLFRKDIRGRDARVLYVEKHEK